MIGDSYIDIQAGQKSGTKNILLEDEEYNYKESKCNFMKFINLKESIDFILS